MRISRRCGVVTYAACLAAAAFVAGCASGPKLPDYVEPELADDKSAVLEGTGGTYISVVDNASPSGHMFRFAGLGGNTVRMTPGVHRVTVVYQGNSGGTPNQGGSSLSVTKSNTNHAFAHKFEAGHKYKIAPDNRWNPFNTAIVLTDETNGQKQRID